MSIQLIAEILGVIVAIDTALAQVPAIQANSTFQLVAGWVAKIAAIFAVK